MHKLRYETDPHNRLVIGETGRKGQLTAFRRIIDGEFKIGADNSLSYHSKMPLDEKDSTDRQLKLIGKWGLNAAHDLIFTLDSWQRQISGDELTLRCQIIDVSENNLVVAVATRAAGGKPSLYMLNLQGSWQADKHNRLTFRANSARANPDILTFAGGWEVNENYELIYRYEKEGLSRGERATQTLCFKGHWDIRDKGRITYVLSAATGSLFDFRASAAVFKDKYIKYELGIGAARKRSPAFKRVITLFGSWRVTPSSGLIFELENNGHRVNSMTLAAQVKLSGKDTMVLALKDSLNRKLGAELELSRDIIRGSGQAFIKLLAAKGEQGVYVGLGRQW